MVAGIEASGVRVIGDLGVLTEPAAPHAEPGGGGPIALPPEVAASMAMGILVASGATRPPAGGRGRLQFAEPELDRLPVSRLAAYTAVRAWLGVTRRLGRARDTALRR